MSTLLFVTLLLLAPVAVLVGLANYWAATPHGRIKPDSCCSIEVGGLDLGAPTNVKVPLGISYQDSECAMRREYRLPTLKGANCGWRL